MCSNQLSYVAIFKTSCCSLSNGAYYAKKVSNGQHLFLKKCAFRVRLLKKTLNCLKEQQERATLVPHLESAFSDLTIQLIFPGLNRSARQQRPVQDVAVDMLAWLFVRL